MQRTTNKIYNTNTICLLYWCGSRKCRDVYLKIQANKSKSIYMTYIRTVCLVNCPFVVIYSLCYLQFLKTKPKQI